MSVKTIDAVLLKKMFLAGAQRLDANKDWINELNVFPVPDGDTGTNMTMTIMSAAREVQAVENPTMESLAKAISQGALRGARGNSGVILSQLFRGFTKAIKEEDVIDSKVMSKAFEKAAETAYKAVMKPKEGTILTVARGMADKAVEIFDEMDDLEEGFKIILEEGDYVLSQTPEMLPVLKQAGVVDSGGQGLMQVLKGCYDAFLGKEIDLSAVEAVQKPKVDLSSIPASDIDTADIKFGYCTEFIVLLEKPYDDDSEMDFKAYLTSIGDSIVCVHDEDIVKVHVHTNDPGLAFQKGLTYGQLTNMKVDNMRIEHHEKLIKDAEKVAAEQKAADEAKAAAAKNAERKESGFIAVSIGEGMNEIFKELGVDHIIEGGQTMNPSTEDILNAIDEVNADTIFVLPNNSNIILAAQQAKTLTEDKNIVVIPSKTVPQGITAVVNFINGESVEENTEHMIEEMANVKSGEVTYAVRDTVIDDKEIKENDIMGIGDAGIIAVTQSVEDTVMSMLEQLVDDESGLVTLYYGQDTKEEDAEALVEKLEEAYPDVDVELQYGGQPIYYYVLSVE